MKIEDLVANLKDAPTTTTATIGLVLTMIGYYKDSIAAAVKAIEDLGYTIAPDQMTMLYIAVGILFLKMMFFEGGKKKE